MTALTFTVAGTDRTIEVSDFDLVVAGYTGRDEAEVRKHIDELAAIGVPPPDSVPAFFDLDPALATQEATVSVAGANTSGEVEPVLVRAGGQLYLTVGSDHTDRDVETTSVAESKAACPKPLGTTVVPVDAPDWDRITLESTVDEVRYQSGAMRALRIPSDVLALYTGPADRDLVMFCGTLPLLGGTFIAGTRWSLSLALPDGVTLTHDYSVS